MSSVSKPVGPSKLVSQVLQEDADLRDLVEEFVEGLESRVTELRQAHDRLDWELLATLAHRLKGAAGSYGYPEISRLCAEMEQRFRSHQAEDFSSFVNKLDSLTRAAQAGLSESA